MGTPTPYKRKRGNTKRGQDHGCAKRRVKQSSSLHSSVQIRHASALVAAGVCFEAGPDGWNGRSQGIPVPGGLSQTWPDFWRKQGVCFWVFRSTKDMEDLAALKSFCWPNSNLWSRSRGRRSEEGEAEPPPPRHAVVPCVPRNEASWSIARPTGKASKEAALLTRIRTPPDGECGASSGGRIPLRWSVTTGWVLDCPLTST